MGGAFFNDIVLDGEGNAYISASFKPFLFKVDGKTLELSLLNKLEAVDYGTVNESPWNLNGIVLTSDQKHLLLGENNTLYIRPAAMS